MTVYDEDIKTGSFLVIQEWMLTKLHLCGAKLLIFATIYGFSKDGMGKCYATLDYLAHWSGCTTQAVINNIKWLVEMNYIIKTDIQIADHQKRCEYVANIDLITQILKYDNAEQQIQTEKLSNSNGSNGTVKKVDRSGKESLSYNIVNSINKDSNTNVLLSQPTKGKLFDANTKQPKTTTKDITVKDSDKPKKKNLYQKCVDCIDEFTDDATTRQLLIDYLQLRLEMKDSPIYANQWKGLLNKLDKMSDTEIGIQEIVRQSIEYGWKSFYEVNKQPKGVKKGGNYSWHNDACNSGLKHEVMTEQDKKELEEDIERRLANGERVYF